FWGATVPRTREHAGSPLAVALAPRAISGLLWREVPRGGEHAVAHGVRVGADDVGTALDAGAHRVDPYHPHVGLVWRGRRVPWTWHGCSPVSEHVGDQGGGRKAYYELADRIRAGDRHGRGAHRALPERGDGRGSGRRVLERAARERGIAEAHRSLGR